MKRVIKNLYTLKGGEATRRTNELKRILGLGESSAGFVFSEAATTHIDITGNATTCIKTSTGTFATGINLGGTLTTGITIGACTTALVVTGATTTALSVTGASTTGLGITDATTGILLTYTGSKTEGISMTVATTKTLGTGMSLSGAGTYTTGILLDATAITTGISITAGSLTDGIKISGTTPVDGIEVSSACSGSALNLSGANAKGISISGANTTAAIDIPATASRAIRIGTKESSATSVAISSGESVDAEPANNYLFGLFAKVASDESAITDELRGAWIRTRVNDGCHVGVGSVGYGYGVCGAEIQLKIYADAATTEIAGWQNSAVWAQLETQGASTVTFVGGSVSQCVLANVGLTSTTIIEADAVVAGVTINSNTAGTGVTATGGFYGIYICQDNATCLDFTDGIHVVAGSCSTGINIEGGATYVPMLVGTKGNTSGSGLVLAGDADDSGGVQIYCDDGGVTTVGDVLSPLRCRYLVTVGQTSGKTQCGSFSQIRTLGTTGSPLIFDTGSVRAAYIFNQLGGNTLTTSAEIQGINQATTLAGNMIVGAGCRFAGVDINIAGSGTIANSGVCAALLIRSRETPVWTNGIQIEDAGAVTGINVGAVTTVLNISSTATQVVNVAAVAGISNFITFNDFGGCLQTNDVDPNDTPSDGGLGADGCIRILVNGADYFIPIFATEIS